MCSAGKGGIWLCGNIISPRDPFETVNADDCVDSDEEEDEDSHPLRRISLFEPLKSQSPGIWRLPLTVITSHFFVP
jgi:hypothetical protein